MKTELKNAPAFTTLFVTLEKNESIIAESDAMASMSAGMNMKAMFNGGFIQGLLKKFFGKESLFVNEFSCPDGADSAELVITQPTPGDMKEIDLNGTSYYIQPGAYIAHQPGVKLSLGWAGFKSWFSGEGLFRLKVSGTGKVWIGAYGGIHEKDVTGEYIVDTSHLVAYEPTVSLNVGMAGGIISSILSGEGFVSKMQGKGRIFVQSRSMDGLASWTNGKLPLR